MKLRFTHFVCTSLSICLLTIPINQLDAFQNPNKDVQTNVQNESKRPRLRELGIEIGILPTGPLNAITDIPGVTVGHHTLIEGDDVRTGVTVVRPHAGNVFFKKSQPHFTSPTGLENLSVPLKSKSLASSKLPLY